jgi:hypothetical protein
MRTDDWTAAQSRCSNTASHRRFVFDTRNDLPAGKQYLWFLEAHLYARR